MNVFDEALSAGVPVVNLNENEAILRHEMDLYKLSPVHLKTLKACVRRLVTAGTRGRQQQIGFVYSQWCEDKVLPEVLEGVQRAVGALRGKKCGAIPVTPGFIVFVVEEILDQRGSFRNEFVPKFANWRQAVIDKVRMLLVNADERAVAEKVDRISRCLSAPIGSQEKTRATRNDKGTKRSRTPPPPPPPPVVGTGEQSREHNLGVFTPPSIKPLFGELQVLHFSAQQKGCVRISLFWERDEHTFCDFFFFFRRSVERITIGE